MLKKFLSSLNGQSKTITSAAIIIGAASLTSKILGVFRDRVLAGEFGAERTLDIYYASFRIPDFIFNILVLGALSAGFIPVFTDYLKKDEKDAWVIVSNVLNIMFISLIVTCGVLILYTPQIVKLLTPGFNADELKITSDVTRIMFLSPILLGIAGVLGGVLQSFKRFFIYSFAPIMYNIGIIMGALFLAPTYGIYGLAWGVVAGAALHMLVQFPSVIYLGFRPKLVFNFGHMGVRKIFAMMVPRTLSLGVAQINLLIVTVIGSTLEPGSITIFNLASNLQSVPLVIFGVSFAIAAFPSMAENANNKEKFIESFSLTLRQILFFVVPSSALIILLRAQIVRVALGSGNFDWHDTVLTINTLAIFSISLFAQSLIQLISRAFFAYKDSITPFMTGIISTGINIFLSIFLIYVLKMEGVVALSVAFSISSLISLLFMWLILKIKLGDLDETAIFSSSLKICIASFCMALSVQGMKYAIEPFFGTSTFIGIALQGFLASVVGIAIYFIVCFILKSPEAILFVSSLEKKFLKKYTPSEPVDQS